MVGMLLKEPLDLLAIIRQLPLEGLQQLAQRQCQAEDGTAYGMTREDLINKLPIEVGLQTESGYPHQGLLDYADPSVNQSTGTLQVRAIFENSKRALLPGYFLRVRVPLRAEPALLVPEVALGTDQGGRYVLAVNADNVVEQRRVELGQTVGAMRVVVGGLKPDERVVVAGILDAVPGQKVDPQLRTAEAADPAASK